MPLAALPDPNFIDRDPAAITQEMVSQYEAMTGKTLYPAQPERLVVDMVAFRETLTRIGVQGAAMLNLVRYSRAPILDYLGELVGVARLPASPALATIRFTLGAVLTLDLAVPAGTRLATKDNKQVFATVANSMIPAGSLYADISAQAESPGVAANGYLPGEINQLLTLIDGIKSAASVTTSFGGLDPEDDDRLRQRIMLAPEGFAAAGPEGAYRFHAMGAHQDIIDAAVLNPSPGLVAVYPLTTSGVITTEILALVLAELNQERRRPITDQVVVLPPGRIVYSIVANVTLLATAVTETVVADIQTKLAAHAAYLRSRLGVEVVPSRLVSIVMGCSGVYRVELQSPDFLSLAPNQFADVSAITVNVVGWSNG
ncbi:MAG: baseplate J/gp47 family protein [Desulfovibrionaceae bacterium]|nr:baseplate J/gp47 family protein [Desulfovibrionaceae bacterium]MBF0513618.1 baseplate J/gp47 family protein [Desulfovibrionaceae bacterium]